MYIFNLLVHWKKSPAAIFVPLPPWSAPFGSTSGRPNALLRVCVPLPPWSAPFGSTSGRPNALLRVCQTSASLPAAKGATFAAYLVDVSASPTAY